MKIYPITVALMAAVSCQPLLNVESGTRSSHYIRTVYDGETVSDSLLPKSKFDTVLYYSTVEFPSGYDWKRDSACGNSKATLTIYRNFEPLGSFETGENSCIGTDPDTHHWIEGNLYTEYNLYGQTVITKNGKELFRYNGQEFLKGLLVRGEEVWTLGQNSNGKGFSLRRNGEALLTDTQGQVFGDLTSSAHGALYMDSEQICFCYQRQAESAYNMYKVSDSHTTLVGSSARTIYDMIVLDGKVSFAAGDGRSVLLERESGSLHIGGSSGGIENAWLCRGGQGETVCFAEKGGSDPEYFVWSGGISKRIGSCSQIFMYSQPDRTFKYARISGLGISLCDGDRGVLRSFPKPGLISRSCIKFMGNESFLAYNGQNGDSRIVFKGRDVPVNVNGYVSALDVTIIKVEEEK